MIPIALKGSSGPAQQARHNICGRELEAFEVAMFDIAMQREPLPAGNFDPAHYRSVHHHLFQDVYDWAGEHRTIRIAKNDAMFCFPEHIADQMELAVRFAG